MTILTRKKIEEAKQSGCIHAPNCLCWDAFYTLSALYEVVEAAEKFNTKVDELTPAIQGSFVIQAIHGIPYKGNNWSEEKKNLEQKLKPFSGKEII